MKRDKKKLGWGAKVLLLGGVAFVGCTACTQMYIATHVPSGKYDPVTDESPPANPQAQIRPERQVEGHTCGFHSLESIYKSYGLDPESYRLRFRLGTDNPAVKLDSETTGTLQPDMLRVLRQDGFDARPVEVSQTAEIRTHLEAGHYAVAIVMRSVHHWVVLAELLGRNLVIVDSLEEKPYIVDIDPFLADEAYNVILIKPGVGQEKVSIKEAHREGIRDMLRTWRAGK